MFVVSLRHVENGKICKRLQRKLDLTRSERIDMRIAQS